MKYQSLYRKWRPQIFEDIIGQKYITQTLMNAVSLNRISHAYVFSGPRGVGKTTTARIFAKSLNCKKGPTIHPCNKCENCIKITEGYSMDVIEIDGASNRGIDDIRDLRSKIKFAPTEGRYKVYIIDEVHMLTTEAFNALLKTLEEPPSHVIFIFATTAPHKIPKTILSRCQWFNFRRIPLQNIIDKLKIISVDEKLNIDDKALNIIARNATGSMRDAESTLDQIIAYCGEEIKVQDVIDVLGIIAEEVFFDIVEAIIKNDTIKAIEIINQTSNLGEDPSQFVKNLMEYIHNLSLIKICDRETLNSKGIFIEDRQPILKQSKSIKMQTIFDAVNYLAEIEKKMKYTRHPWILLEMFAIKFSFQGENKEIKKEKSSSKSVLKQKKLEKKEEVLNKKEDKAKEDKAKEKKEYTVNYSEISSDSEFKKAWVKILDKIKKTRISLYSFLTANNSVDIGNDKLIINFDNEHIFHKEILEKKNNKSLLQELIKEEIGRSLIIECAVTDNNKKSYFSKRRNEEENILAEEEKMTERSLKNKDKIKTKSYKLTKDDSLLNESLNLFEGKIVEE
ncbi:MAG: DNA polymerase III subunit gamma/tau [Candidatus Caldatribacteriota bacterium]|nr:DNA polymerase III subunit gamma/tau [Candidatus Caldatribacteriota bacterium]